MTDFRQYLDFNATTFFFASTPENLNNSLNESGPASISLISAGEGLEDALNINVGISEFDVDVTDTELASETETADESGAEEDSESGAKEEGISESGAKEEASGESG